MTINIVKLDGRNTGYGKFKYAIIPVYSQEFYEIRKWMWDTWGASKELKEWMIDSRVGLVSSPVPVGSILSRIVSVKAETIRCQNEHWCWQNDDYARRLYLRTDKELVLFKLRWE